jgi:hypothetical protein
MAKLIVSLEGSVIRDYPLEKERVTIGRKPHNDIQIENLAVSGEHACIVTILNDSFLEDLGSTNGTLVNGNSVKKHILQNNDMIEIGKYRLKYVSDAPLAGRTTIDEFEKTMVLRAPGLARAASGRATEGTPSGPRTMGARIPPPTPRPSATSQMFPGGRDAAASAPQAPSRGRDAASSGAGTSPGGRPATASGPFTSPGNQDATASRPPAGAAGKPEGVAGVASSPNVAVASTPASAAAAESPAKPTPGPTATSPGTATEPARTSATEAHPLGAIQILSGSGAGKELDLVKNLTTLGKPGVQVAVITRRPQGYFITHVEGATSPEVNGRALDAQARLLHDHDVIELAGVKMEFFLKK